MNAPQPLPEMVRCQKCRAPFEIDETTYMDKWTALEDGFYCEKCAEQERSYHFAAMLD